MHAYVERKDGVLILVFSGSFEILCYPLELKWRELLVRYLAGVLTNLHENGRVSDVLSHRNGWFQPLHPVSSKTLRQPLIKFKTLVLLVALISTSALLY